MTAETQLDPKNLPQITDRKRIEIELREKGKAAMARNEPLVASLYMSDALMLFPNDRETLDAFDEIVFTSKDPLSLFPVATGAIHVATAAGRARVLMIQKHLPDAIALIGRVLEVAPELEYLDWVRRWLMPHSIPTLTWDLLMGSVVKPALLMVIGVPVPPKPDDPRLFNVRSAAEIFDALLPVFPEEKVLYAGAAMAKRRLGNTQATLDAATEGVRKFPQDWGLRTALMNALRDAKRPDEALREAQVAMQIDPQDLSPLHDAAWGFLDAGRAEQAAGMFQDLVQRDPHYPNGQATLHYARIKAWNAPEDRRALLQLRERKYWDEDIERMANEIEPPVPFVTQLPGPADASAHYARAIISELSQVMRCCGRGAKIGVTISSDFPESPSAALAFDVGMRALGAQGAVLTTEVKRVQQPDPRENKGRTDLPVWNVRAGAVTPVYPYGDQNAQMAVGGLAFQLFRKDIWDPAAAAIAHSAGPQAIQAFMSVFTNPPAPPPDFDAVTWTYRSQIACALIVSHMGPWESGPARPALYSLASGPSDWTSIAGIVALAFRASDSPAARTEVEGAFTWLRGLVSPTGFTPWERALIDCFLTLPDLAEPLKADLLNWRTRYFATISEKNSVQSIRRYGGLSLEEYAAFSSERDKLQGGLVYGGVGAAMRAAFAPAQNMQALCQKYGVNPGAPFVDEWQQALNANPDLMNDFIEAKREYEFSQMGVKHEEKAALDNILDGNMDMHLRMAQAQEAQAQVAAGGPGAGDPDPLVFPGQKVQRLSDYVRILKGMQTGNMQGALAQYGLDMMSYGQVAGAWAAKMAADPTLTEKFSRMMAG